MRKTPMHVTIYHNPRCSKSRKTLALLRAQHIEPEIIEYLKDPPSESTLNRLIGLLGIEPADLLRKKEPEYRLAQLDQPALDNHQILSAMRQYPILIERPIVVVDHNRAVIGRPPENILALIHA